MLVVVSPPAKVYRASWLRQLLRVTGYANERTGNPRADVAEQLIVGCSSARAADSPTAVSDNPTSLPTDGIGSYLVLVHPARHSASDCLAGDLEQPDLGDLVTAGERSRGRAGCRVGRGADYGDQPQTGRTRKAA